MEQARHVREGRWDAPDRDDLAEEIESFGREQFNKPCDELAAASGCVFPLFLMRKCQPLLTFKV
jgi:hypothetical protein